MRLLRSLRGGQGASDDERPDGRDEGVVADDPGRSAETEAAFEAGLSDLARRQLRYARYAWTPGAAAERQGTWLTAGPTDARTLDGDELRLAEGTALEYAETRTETLEAGPGRPPATIRSFRFRLLDGREVELTEDAAGPEWPADLVRPGASREEG